MNCRAPQNRATKAVTNVKYEDTDQAKLLKELNCLSVRQVRY